MGEGALLSAVSKDGHRLSLEQLVHKNADFVAVAVADILFLSIHVVGTEDHVGPGWYVQRFQRASRLFGSFRLNLYKSRFRDFTI